MDKTGSISALKNIHCILLCSPLLYYFLGMLFLAGINPVCKKFNILSLLYSVDFEVLVMSL